MKKLLALACCVLFMHSFSQPPVEGITMVSAKTSGHKNLIKAIAVFVNPDGNKKEPVKKINLFTSACS